MKKLSKDRIVIAPSHIDLTYSPLRSQIKKPTTVLGAFNPGMTRLKNGNILLLIRIAEAPVQPEKQTHYLFIRWRETDGYQIESVPMSQLDRTDPRKYRCLKYDTNAVYILTSFSWLLPVELDPDGSKIIHYHYDKPIIPQKSYQEFGIEDPRITRIADQYYMTCCSVSSERHCTTLYHSTDGLNYGLMGMIQDHQNKDVILFPEKVHGRYLALTRPLGAHYFAPRLVHPGAAGPSINLAASPDLYHWQPLEKPLITCQRSPYFSLKVGGGAPPILTDQGWLILFHGVEKRKSLGIYRTFWGLLAKDDPAEIIYLEDKKSLIDPQPELFNNYQHQPYVSDIVFTTGIILSKYGYLVASGESDMGCRLTYLPKDFLSLKLDSY